MISDPLLGVPSIDFFDPSSESLCIRGSQFGTNENDAVMVAIADLRCAQRFTR
jgi:hypothetical protein